MRSSPLRVVLVSFAAVVATALFVPSVASAAVGDITFAGCVADGGANGCADPFQDPLDGANGVAVSPDGTSVYVASSTDDSVSHFTRAANGTVSFAGCVADNGANGCIDPFQDPLDGASGVAVSPDGTSVYVTSSNDDAVSHFTRAPNGAISFAGCVADNGAHGCIDPFQDPLDGASGVAVSPDGTSVYVSSFNDDSVSHFTRAPNGAISFAGCVADNGAHGCSDPFQDPLAGANGVAVSPDGTSVYVASLDDSSVSHFTRAPGGSIVFAGCVADGGANGCSDPSQDALGGAANVAVSPDGSSVYVTGLFDNSISHLTRAPGGSIVFAGCVADDGAHGCSDPFQDPLNAASGVAISPDGGSVYVASQGDNSISHLARAANGTITFAGCIADDGAHGCINPPLDPLFGAIGVAVSPDSGSVYVTAFNDDSLSHFTRETPPPPPTAPDPPADTTPPGVTLSAKKVEAGKPIKVTVSCDEECSLELDATAKPKGGKRRGLPGAGTQLAAGASQTLALKPARKLKRQLRKAGKGNATIEAVATDAAGNRGSDSVNVKLK